MGEEEMEEMAVGERGMVRLRAEDQPAWQMPYFSTGVVISAEKYPRGTCKKHTGYPKQHVEKDDCVSWTRIKAVRVLYDEKKWNSTEKGNWDWELKKHLTVLHAEVSGIY